MFGCYLEHLSEVMKHKGNDNLCILHYENMKKDPKSEIKRLNDFLDTKLTEDQINNVRTLFWFLLYIISNNNKRWIKIIIKYMNNL